MLEGFKILTFIQLNKNVVMKHISSFFLFLPIAISAQISIDVTDMSQIGDVITRKADTLTVLTGPGNSGANQTWNFTQLSTYVIDEVTQVMNPSEAPNGSNFPSANLAMTNDNINYLYFDQNANQMVTLGFAGDLLGNGTPIVAPFTSGLLVHNFPRTFGSNFSDNYIIDITLDGSAISPLVSQIRFKRSALILDSTDAWGQLTTPVATYNSLRAKRIEHAVDSIWIKAVFPPTWTLFQVNLDTTISYQWFANQGKLAIAELTYDTLGVPKKYTWFHSAPIGNLTEMNTVNEFNLYPNPVSDELTLSFNDALIGNTITTSIIDETGRIIDEKVAILSTKELNFNTSQLQNGYYFLKVILNNETFTKRFVKG